MLFRSGGSAKEWPNFQRAFQQTTQEGAFNNLENLNRLQQVLYGVAAKSVQQLMMDPDNVPDIMLRLEEHFGRPDQIYKELLADLLKIRRDSRTVVIEMANALENLVNNIKLIRKEEYLADHRLVEDLVKRLPYNIQVKRTEYYLNAQNQLAVQTLDDLEDWLKPFARTARVMMLDNSHNSQQRGAVNHHDQNTKKNKTKNVCLCCKRLHPHKIWDCYTFKRMNAEDRIKVAQRGRLCFGCLQSSNHDLLNCQRNRSCNINGCQRKHHPMLHTNPVGSQPVQTVNKHAEGNSRPSIYYQILPVTLRNKDKSVET